MRRLFEAAVLVAVAAGVAWAPQGSGTSSTLNGRAPALDVAVQTIVFQPGGQSGWHSQRNEAGLSGRNVVLGS